MEKRRITIYITLIGILIIVFSSTYIKFSKSALTNENDYLKGNLRSLAKKCILEEKCELDNVTINSLLENGYINDKIKEKIKEYSTTSYIVYPTYEVVLIKAD